uniref:Uncharacterized protein n=1 Tax=Anguilla anguilla TaxID=7936 RepID=A0A0E9U1N6_ANGAN
MWLSSLSFSQSSSLSFSQWSSLYMLCCS